MVWASRRWLAVRWRWLAAPSILAGCSTSDSGGTPYVPEVDEAPVEAPLPDPAWDAAGAAQVIDDTLAIGLPDPTTIFVDFQEAWTHVESGCPARMGDYNMVLFVASCDTRAGWTFQGVTQYVPGAGGDFWMLGDGWVRDNTGVTFILAGELERTTTDSGWDIEMRGTWSDPGDSNPWLAQSNGLALWETLDEDGLLINGGYGLGDVDLSFADFRVSDTCTSGAVWLHDPGGAWYTVELGDDCDACGTVSYAGTELGEACLSVSEPVADLLARME